MLSRLIARSRYLILFAIVLFIALCIYLWVDATKRTAVEE